MVDFNDMYQRCSGMLRILKAKESDLAILAEMKRLRDDIGALRSCERREKGRQPFREFLFEKFQKSLNDANIASGVIAEVGGSKNSFLTRLPQYERRYLSIIPERVPDPNTLLADITNCPQIPSESFDAIFSVSVLEHVTHIQDAGREIVRLLKPGGVTMHAVPFSYFFHGAPVDYWRVTTTALESIFEELETIECFFYNSNRRRNNVGSQYNPIDKDGGPQFSVDAMGGWRENWFTIYIGRKLPFGAKLLMERRLLQAVIDITKELIVEGLAEEEALRKALELIRHVSYDRSGRLEVSAQPLDREEGKFDFGLIKLMWDGRSAQTIRPSPARWATMSLLRNKGLI